MYQYNIKSNNMKNGIGFICVIVFCFFAGCEKNESTNGLNGVTFTGISSEEGGDFELDGNIVNYNEIIGYDSTDYIFLLSEEAGERIRIKDYPVSPTRFAIAVDGILIYVANFIPGYSSMSCEDCLTIEPYSYDNKYSVELGYPGSNFFSGIDSRNDKRIILRLQRDNKLIDIDK
jgi:hypothetical protein